MIKHLKQMIEVRSINLPQNGGKVSLLKDKASYVIHRFAARGKVNNYIGNYELLDQNNNSRLLDIDLDYGNKILDRIESGENYSNVFIFYTEKTEILEEPYEKSAEEHKYTSTGIKFWRHQQQMFNYKSGDPNTVISTHISPEGTCNLKCPYCSVTHRDTHSRLDLDTIKRYVLNLKKRGLKAVILTGGGEPTAYKHFNELIRWIKSENLSVALITNGTLTNKVDDDVWALFSWIRVSINVFGKWVQKISLPTEKIDFEKTVVGCSMVYTVEHELSDEIMNDRVALLQKAAIVADNCGAKYIRLLPNCLLDQYDLLRQHKSLDNTLHQIDDKRFFHQYKIHGAPQCSKCHQSYFRPYLSEEIHALTGKPGTVYPCDSVVLNDGYQHFAQEYQLCHADDILDYIDGNVKQSFDAKTRCTGCVFTENVNMLDDWVSGKINKFDDFDNELMHEEFV
jgi:MoaA/NifB/PqqE/SkfB family radical SAM enzyme